MGKSNGTAYRNGNGTKPKSSIIIYYDKGRAREQQTQPPSPSAIRAEIHDWCVEHIAGNAKLILSMAYSDPIDAILLYIFTEPNLDNPFESLEENKRSVIDILTISRKHDDYLLTGIEVKTTAGKKSERINEGIEQLNTYEKWIIKQEIDNPW